MQNSEPREEDDDLREILLHLDIDATPADDQPPAVSHRSKHKLSKLQRALQALRYASAQDSRPDCAEDDLWRATLAERERQEIPASGRYRFVRRLGEGGFGIVFLAYDAQLKREVAIKLPRPDIFLTKGMVQRFLREAQNVARLAHPNIVPVLATDDSSEMPAIAYHFCNGPTLAAWLRDSSGDVDVFTVAKIGLLLAEAVQHAHSRGILHRDLKPTNILLEPSTDPHPLHGFHDGEQYWIPRIIDFGISKAKEAENSDTTSVAMLGTPPYMSPEQLAGRTREVGTHSDIYALGVILYELVAKRRPHSAVSAVELLIQIKATNIASLRKFRSDCSPDFDAIVARCLNADERDRYATAAELAADLRRFIEGKPVSVRSLSNFGRLKKWAVRQPVVASLVVACVLLSLFGAGATGVYLRNTSALIGRLVVAQQKAAQSLRDLRQQLYALDTAAANEAFNEGDISRYHSLLVSHIGSGDEEDLRDVAWHYLWHRGHREHSLVPLSASALYSIRLSHDGRYLAICGADGIARLVNAHTQQVFMQWDTGQSELNGASFSDDDRYLATTGDDGTVSIWETGTKNLLNRFPVHSGHAFQAVFVSGDRLITCGDEPVIRVWNWRTGAAVSKLEGHVKTVQGLVVSNDGRQLYSASDDGTRRIWNLETLECDYCGQNLLTRCVDIQVPAAGPWFYTACVNGAVLRDGKSRSSDAVETIIDEADGANAIAISPDGCRLAVAMRSGVIRIEGLNDDGRVETTTGGNRLKAWFAHEGRIHDLAFSSDGEELYSVGEDGTFRIWSARDLLSSAALEVREQLPPGHSIRMELAQLSSHTCVFVADTLLFTWNCVSDRCQRVGSFDRLATRIAAARAGALVVTTHEGGSVRAWRVAEEHAQEVWVYHWPQPEPISGLAYSDARNEVAVAVEDWNEVHLLDAATGREIKRLELPAGVGRDNDGNLAYSSDGRWLASAWEDNIVLWNRDTDAATQLVGHANMVSALAFHPDSRILFSGSDDRTIRMWDVANNQCIGLLGHHKERVTSLLPSADGRVIFSADHSGCTSVWHVASRKQLFELESEATPVDISQNFVAPTLFRVYESGKLRADHLGTSPLPRVK